MQIERLRLAIILAVGVCLFGGGRAGPQAISSTLTVIVEK